ncbi:MAG: beta-ketoacyl synthase N-terminal-like domain-containing protein, partial [bacterium]|nr:beta-ketoacyl synthase N-terminal-like domain-containing protein [bacterium]
MNKRRVVVTGMGMLTPVGLNVKETWQNILAGVSGVSAVDDFDTSDYSTKIWAKVKNFNIENHVPLKDARRMDMFTQYGIAAADEAISDAGLTIDETLSRRVGVAVGAGIGGIQTITNNQDKLVLGGPRKVSPFFIPAGIINMVAGQS